MQKYKYSKEIEGSTNIYDLRAIAKELQLLKIDNCHFFKEPTIHENKKNKRFAL